MDPRHSVSIEVATLRADRDVVFGDVHNYYGAAERSGVHVGVPPRPTHFVGREALVADVARRLAGGASLALSADGLPGVGKTTLAVALAYRRDVLDHFTDGVLWGALGLQPNVMEVLATWAAALGTDVSSATEPETRAAWVRNAIGQRRFLLVIDDAWEPAENALLLKCGGPGCAHFLTTRDESIARAFAGVGGSIEIRELAPDDALALLAALAPEACAADPESAARLVEAVGFLPLAIELLGAYLSSAENRYFREQQEAALRRIADPAERLRQACRRLGDARGTEVTLRETIHLSLQGLPDEAVAAFHALGAFAPKPETFDLKAALAVTGASAATLSRLIERHLLEQQDDTLSLHQTIADAARDETPADAARAHADHYLRRVHEAGADWRAIEAIYGQVKWGFARMGDDVARSLEFTAALARYQAVRGLRDDDFQWNERELRAAAAAGDRQREAAALCNRGWLLNTMGERHRAREMFQRALPLARAVGDRQGEAVILDNLAQAHRGLGEPEPALELHARALAILRAVGDRRGEALSLANAGLAHQGVGDHARALAAYREALAICGDVGDRASEAVILHNIGHIHDELGEPDHALELYQRALPVHRAVGNRLDEAVTLNNIGLVYNGLGEHRRALEFFQQALPLSRAVGDRRGEAVTLNNIGLVHDYLGERGRALEFYREALALLRAVDDRANEAVTRCNIAMIHRAEGRLEEAIAELRQVVELDVAVQHPDLESDRQLLAEVEAELAEREGRRDV